jgi:hypothetical protein
VFNREDTTNSFYSALLVPPLLALGVLLLLTHIEWAKSAGDGARIIWALLLVGAVIGWPVSCAAGAVLTPSRSSWIAH